VGRGRDGGAIVERPVVMGTGQLFGVLTEPEGGPVPSLPTALFFDAGRINHIGPGRLWVEMARKLGREGFRSVRFDLSGIGDSPTRPGRTDQVQYPTEAIADIGEVRRSISVDDDTNFVLIGVCSGTYHAVESALDKPVRAICAINPVLTLFAPGDPSERVFEPPERGGPSARAERSSTSRWTLSVARRGLMRHAVRHMPQAGWWVVNRFIMGSIPANIIKRVTALGADVFVVAGLWETRLLQRGEQRTIHSLVRSGHLRIETIPHLEHSLIEKTGREQVADVVIHYLAGRFAADSPQRAEPGSDAPT
jgi:pimeloyl-ACP methyl ester carboxylesterase